MTDEKNLTCNSYPFRCSFESNFCEWKQSDDNVFNWRRASAFNTQSNIRPQRDHTTNSASGSYIYIETTGKPSGSKSTMFGPVINAYPSTACRMRLFYYMNGKSVGRLSVSLRSAIGSGYLSLWRAIGPLGEYWERAEFAISSINQNRELIIEAEVGNYTSEEGVIAVDDISFTPECKAGLATLPTIITSTAAPACGQTGYKCASTPTKCINQTQVCDFVKDCPNGDDESNCGTCDFETSTCGWDDESFGGHMWNKTTALNSGLPSDNTIGNQDGSLMYYETEDLSSTGFSRLYSPMLRKSSSHCEFEFYYYKVDDSKKAVSFSLWLEDTDGNKQKLWRTEEETNNNWKRDSVGINARNGFRLYFEAFRLSQQNLDKEPKLAIDDTKFVNCPMNYNISCSDVNAFRCQNNMCIPKNLVCDYSKDCSDGSDETDCHNYTRCGFENDLNPLCNWNSDDDADIYWKRGNGEMFEMSIVNYPTYDHTTLTPQGSFYYNDYMAPMSKTARLSSPVFYPASKADKCSFRMWYYLNGMIVKNERLRADQASSIKIYTRTMIGGNLLLIKEITLLDSNVFSKHKN